MDGYRQTQQPSTLYINYRITLSAGGFNFLIFWSLDYIFRAQYKRTIFSDIQRDTVSKILEVTVILSVDIFQPFVLNPQDSLLKKYKKSWLTNLILSWNFNLKSNGTPSVPSQLKGFKIDVFSINLDLTLLLYFL